MEETIMDIIVKWATILSPIIAVLLAWWASKSSNNESKKQIAALKDLAILQIDTTMLEMEYEFFKAETNMKDYRDEIDELQRELQRLNINPSTTELERQEFLRKIAKLTNDTNWQKAWWMKLFLTQANLSFARKKIINNMRK